MQNCSPDDGPSIRFTSRLSRALPNATLGEPGRAEPDFFMGHVAAME